MNNRVLPVDVACAQVLVSIVEAIDTVTNISGIPSNDILSFLATQFKVREAPNN